MTNIDTAKLNQFIIEALAEDIGDGDHTSLACIPSGAQNKARLMVKDDGILAGVEFAERVFRHLDSNSKIHIHHYDGEEVKYGDIPFEIEANTQALLKGERTVLNTMQRMSGIATMSHQFAMEVEDLPVTILDTRKTTPLLRFFEKWAVRIGGCTNYRDGLYDWIMLKDNHIDACGGIKKAIDKVHAYLNEKQMDLGITIEVRNLVELHEVLATGGVTRIMLDNFEIPILYEAVSTVNKEFETEASGGIHIMNVRDVALSGVDYISVGALTHSAGSLDLSLKITK
jgi:nicotinate-nucleotide pyrophosphorylase (carboxylating)